METRRMTSMAYGCNRHWIRESRIQCRLSRDNYLSEEFISGGDVEVNTGDIKKPGGVQDTHSPVKTQKEAMR